MKRKVNAIWKGDGADGKGFLSAQSGAFDKMPYSFKTRFENDEGKLGTNPEELIAAAHAGCFNMKLSFVLNEAGYNPEELNTDAVLTFVDGKIISIELQPGDLQIFFGRNSIHRVAPLIGKKPRYVAIFSYVGEPGMIGSPERTKQLYGKTLPIHHSQSILRKDGLID